MLVTAAVIVLLPGLVTIYLQSARESARRLQCGHNLRQLGLGLHLHHQTLGCLPPSRGGPDSTATQVWGDSPKPRPYPGPGVGAISGFVMLLPYIGEEALHLEIEAAGYPFVFSQVYMSAQIPTLRCPADPAASSHNYLFSIGDRFGGFWPGFNIPPAENAAFQRSLRGLFGLQSRVRFESVHDGLASTIALSECVSPTGLGRAVKAGETVDGIGYSGTESEAVLNDRFAVSMSHGTSPADCLANFSGAGFRAGTTLMTRQRSPGWLWSYGRPSLVSFSTVLPPNGPRCNGYETDGSLTPQSRHVGGVCAVMADGAVRFVADDIDAGDPAAADRVTGPSPYGVWGALGSRDGKEAFGVLP